MRRGFLIVPALLVFASGCGAGGGAGVAPGPVIDQVIPSRGPRSGGNPVRLLGSGFLPGAFVTLGHQAVPEPTWVSGSELDLLAPADSPGLANLTVVNPDGGEGTMLGGYVYLPDAAVFYPAVWFPDAPDPAQATPILVSGSALLSGLDLSLSPSATGSISGTLFRLGRGAQPGEAFPLAGEPVRAVRADGTLAPVTTLAGPDGAWTLSGLAPGGWIVESAEAGRSALCDRAWPGVLDPALAAPIQVEAGVDAAGHDLFLAPGGSIQGRITGDGQPLGGVEVEVAPADGNPLQSRSASTATDGSFALAGLAPGLYRERATAPALGRVGEYWPHAVEVSSAGTLRVTGGGSVDGSIDLDPAGAIGGTVLETPDGEGLPGVEVVASDLVSGGEFAAVSGADGGYSIPGLPPGRYRVGAPELGLYYLAVTSSAAASPVVVAAGQTNGGVNFLGRLGGDLACSGGESPASGRVLGPGGVPLLRARVTLVSGSAAGLVVTESGRDGGWSACLGSGSSSAEVVAPFSTLVAGRFPVSSGGVNDLRLAPGATLSGTVRDGATGAPLSGVLVRLVDGSGHSAVQAAGPAGQFLIQQGSAGGIAPGNWQLSADPSEIRDSP